MKKTEKNLLSFPVIPFTRSLARPIIRHALGKTHHHSPEQGVYQLSRYRKAKMLHNIENITLNRIKNLQEQIPEALCEALPSSAPETISMLIPADVFTYHSGMLAAETPVLFSSPHSGREYPTSFLAQTALPFHLLQKMEDRFVDHLFKNMPFLGNGVLEARFPRSFCDLNRHWRELDPILFQPPLNLEALHYTDKVRAGYGVIPRFSAPGRNIYKHCLDHKEAEKRLLTYWHPYHQALQNLLEERQRVHGCAILFDVHSMPQLSQSRPCDIVIGDRHGQSCSPLISCKLEQAFTERGYYVQRNIPYAGGYITRHYGRPSRHQHVLQIEICRSRYLNLQTLTPNRNFLKLRNDLQDIFAGITTWLLQNATLNRV